MKYIAIAYDSTKLPRAWGVSTTKTDAEAIAKIELEAYREEHSDRAEPFTIKTKTLV